MGRRLTDEVERFWSKVVKGSGDACWEFRSSVRGARRYPYKGFALSGSNKHVYAHVYMFNLAHGAVPHGKIVRHACDNHGCVNPKHLVSGTHRDNTHDAIKRGRFARGERSGTSRLTTLEVRAIRVLYTLGFRQTSIAASFRITQAAVSAICLRKLWRHV